MDGAGMMNHLPEAFVNRMRKQLGNELSAFLRALDDPPVRGIRLNPFKLTQSTFEYIKNVRIPWAENGYYLPLDSNVGSSIFHAAGAYYIQEPGAMLPASVLNAKPGETILDLCAAPGGKSTQIGCSMKGKGLLVCNEPVPKRAVILSGNIERIGLPNTVVTCEWPEKIAKQWPEGFDAVLVDALLYIIYGKRIVVLGIDIVGQHVDAHLAPGFLCAQRGTDVAPGSHHGLRHEVEVVVPVADTLGADGQQAGHHGFAGGNEYVVAFANQQVELLHPVEGVALQVNLAGLHVAQWHSVVAHARKLGSQSAYADGLEASGAAVVVEGYSGHVAHGVAHRAGAHLFHIPGGERLFGG